MTRPLPAGAAIAPGADPTGAGRNLIYADSGWRAERLATPALRTTPPLAGRFRLGGPAQRLFCACHVSEATSPRICRGFSFEP